MRWPACIAVGVPLHACAYLVCTVSEPATACVARHLRTPFFYIYGSRYNSDATVSPVCGGAPAAHRQHAEGVLHRRELRLHGLEARGQRAGHEDEDGAPHRGGRDLGCHSTLYVPNAQGWYAYPVRVRGALGASRPAPPVRAQRGRLVRGARTYPTEAPGRTRQLSPRPARGARPCSCCT